MKKKEPRHFTLESEEYLITPLHPHGKHYKVYFKGKECKDIVGVIRTSLLNG